MGFSDDDLKRFKEQIELHYYPGEIAILQALLARLEAAEKVCDHIKENGFPKNMRDKAYDYMNAWRRSKGE